MQALFVGRICDIVRHVRAGNLETARNLVSNSPGVDWSVQLGPEDYAALFSSAPSAPEELAAAALQPARLPGPAPRITTDQPHELQLGMELFV